jgi:hypothetical protein
VLLLAQGVPKDKARLCKKHNKRREKNKRFDGVHGATEHVDGITQHVLTNTVGRVNKQCISAMSNQSECATAVACWKLLIFYAYL